MQCNMYPLRRYTTVAHKTGVPTMDTSFGSNAVDGKVTWSPGKSIFMSMMTAGAVIGGALTFEPSALIIYTASTSLVLCLGHSLGMHRRLIHRSFNCPKWLENTLIHIGTLVGMAGPFGMIKAHDQRDWAQRQENCHDYFCHRKPMLIDMIHQINCEVTLENGPRFTLDPATSSDKFFQFLEKYWKWQNLPYAVAFYLIGGWSWVFWGVCCRVVTCVYGHWFIGYLAHRNSLVSSRSFDVKGAGVQGYNVGLPMLGFVSFGECWHNNHHAFPYSAKLGLYPGQSDLGFATLKAFEKFGLVSDIRVPDKIPEFSDLLTHPHDPVKLL